MNRAVSASSPWENDPSNSIVWSSMNEKYGTTIDWRDNLGQIWSNGAVDSAETHLELRQESVDQLVQESLPRDESLLGVWRIGKVDDGPIVGAKEERPESLLIQLEDELRECSQSILFNLVDVLRTSILSVTIRTE